MTFDLSGRVVTITGGNRGIGLGMATAIAEAGASVAIWARDEAASAAAVDHLRSLGADAEAFTVDVTAPDAVDAGLAATVDRFGRIDTMIANAGAGFPGATLDLSYDDWRRALAVNLDGTFLTLRAAARHMVERGGGGALVGVSSTSAIHGAPANVGYSSAKTAVLGLVRGLAVELARHGIRANTLMPGWTETEMTEVLRGWEKFMDATTARTPVRRWATPADMGPAAVFLSDPTIAFHTGDCVVVDGGYTVF